MKGKAGQWLVYEIDQSQEPRREIVSEPSISQLKITKGGDKKNSVFILNEYNIWAPKFATD